VNGPDLGFREAVGLRGLQARDSADEAELERVLEDIDEAVRRDLEQSPPRLAVSEDDAWDQLAVIESWAAVASNAAARFYAPASPWPRNLAGWSTKAVARLRSIANRLKPALHALLSALQAVGFSIAVSFPWGISIGLSF